MDGEESSSSSEHNEQEEVTDQEERLKIREQLSTMSFEDLQNLKNDMGSKLYNETVLGVGKTKQQTNFKRANKNRPREMSSKKKTRLENTVVSVKKSIPRDPRFDPLCGEFDKKAFKNNYKFVNELRKKEKTTLEKLLEGTNNVARKKEIEYVAQRLDNQIREEEKRDKIEQMDGQAKREIRDKLKRGEKVQFKKKSVKRLESLISKYEELKKTNKLQKHLEKRSKTLFVKDRKKMERQKLL